MVCLAWGKERCSRVSVPVEVPVAVAVEMSGICMYVLEYNRLYRTRAIQGSFFLFFGATFPKLQVDRLVCKVR